MAVASVVLTYAVAVASAFGLSAWYWHQSEQYDRNHDGVITLEEQSPAQSSAQSIAINDAGLNLSVLFAVPWALLVSASLFVPIAVFRRLSRKPRDETHFTRTTSPGSATVVGRERDA